jgi:hypothetical protein
LNGLVSLVFRLCCFLSLVVFSLVGHLFFEFLYFFIFASVQFLVIWTLWMKFELMKISCCCIMPRPRAYSILFSRLSFLLYPRHVFASLPLYWHVSRYFFYPMDTRTFQLPFLPVG